MKILFCLGNMNLGGTEKSLLNLISVLPESYQIDLLLFKKKGELMQSLPSNVTVYEIENSESIISFMNKGDRIFVRDLIKSKQFYHGLASLFFLLLKYILRVTYNPYFLIKNLTKPISKKYDIAIAYAGPQSFITAYIIDYVDAKKKYQWLHFDIDKIFFPIKNARYYYPKFDFIITLSKTCSNNLIKKIPALNNDKVINIPNILIKQAILRLAEENIDNTHIKEFNGIKLFSTGRLSIEKGYQLFIPVIASLKKENINLHWYIIGDGNYKNYLIQLIKEYAVENNITFLGSQLNPFKYMRFADIYVQPSLHEGFCLTIAEAKVLNLPILSGKTEGAGEQIVNNYNGLLVDIDEKSFYDGMKKMLNPGLRATLSKNLKADLDNDDNIRNIRKLFDF